MMDTLFNLGILPKVFSLLYYVVMKIRYTGLYEEIYIKLYDLNFEQVFKRNRWFEVQDHIGNRLLQNQYFISDLDFDNLIPLFEIGGKFAFVRYGALGDLIQLLPIVRYIKERFPGVKITLVSTESYSSPLRRERDAFDEIIPFSSFRKNDYIRSFFLDGVLEADHNPENPESKIHRVKIFEKFFGLSLKNYDFSIQYTKQELSKVEDLLCSL